MHSRVRGRLLSDRCLTRLRSGPLAFALVLTALSGPAQTPVSNAMVRKPPFADPVMDGIMRRILTHMDGFHADSSLHYIDQGLRHIAHRDLPEELYYLLTYRAEVLYYEGLFTEAMRDLDRSMPLAERLQDSLLVANVHNLRGLTYESIHEDRSALPHLRAALAWYPMHPATRYPVTELYHIHGNLGTYLMSTGHLDSAALHLPVSLRLAEAAQAQRATAVGWCSLGRLALARQDPDSASHCFLRCTQIARAHAEHDVLLDGYAGLAIALARSERSDSARATLDAGLRHAADHPDAIGRTTLRNFARDRATALRLLGDPEGALEAMGAWHRLDSAISVNDTKAALDMQSELLRSEAARELEQVQNERLADALKRVRFSRALIFGGGLVVILVLSGAYLGYRSRQRTKDRLAAVEVVRLQQERTIAELRIREQVGRDMHDDLGAGLSGLKLRSEMAARSETDPAKRAHFAAMAEQAGELIGSMRQIIWAMNHDQAGVEDLVVYTSNYMRSYCERNGLEPVVNLDRNLPSIDLSAEQRRNFFLVVKEALHNVVKHANARTVRLVVSCGPGDHLLLTIEDDGIGLPLHARESVGNGLRNMERRIASLGGRIELAPATSAGGNSVGTCLRIDIPLRPPVV